MDEAKCLSVHGTYTFCLFVFSILFSYLAFQPGCYKYAIIATGIVENIVVTITSKAKDNDTFPFKIDCWTSTNWFDDIDAQTANLTIFSKIEQNNKPVLNAKVEYVK